MMLYTLNIDRYYMLKLAKQNKLLTVYTCTGDIVEMCEHVRHRHLEMYVTTSPVACRKL